ncbi:MAG: hypothetical protein R2750_09120 [Bacteroidales bacterium]
MDIGFYISKLLFTNDCVILPGFGGFVTSYAPAKIHPINHSFFPPSKKILFNSQLKRDDGLLLDFIATHENLSYADVKSQAIEFVIDVVERLNRKQKVQFDKIGILQKDIEGNILFEPDQETNYLEDSFGLNSFVSPPIIRKSAQQRLESKFIDRRPVPVREKKNRKVYWSFLAIIPVLVILGWFISGGNFQFENAQKSSVVDFTEPVSKKVTTSELKKNTPNPPLESLNFKEPDANTVETPVDEPIKKAVPVKKYYIIGGSFSIEQNADKLVGILREKGYNAERAGISPSGLHMVSYFASVDKSEVMANLAMIRKNENSSAWLIKK